MVSHGCDGKSIGVVQKIMLRKDIQCFQANPLVPDLDSGHLKKWPQSATYIGMVKMVASG